jgi:hypothetical protein
MRPMIEDLRDGDQVQLVPRERPHRDDPKWWWEVIDLSDTGFDARHWKGNQVTGRRADVAFAKITAHKRG